MVAIIASTAAAQKMPITIVNPHPILEGVEEWVRTGKLYYNPQLAEQATVLLNGENKKGIHPVAWTYEGHGGRTFACSMAPADFAEANFSRLMSNAIPWVAGRPLMAIADDNPTEGKPAKSAESTESTE